MTMTYMYKRLSAFVLGLVVALVGLPASVLADGTYPFVFVSTRDGSQELWTAMTDGTGLRKLTQTGGGPSFPGKRIGAFALSPDGTKVVYGEPGAYIADLWVYDIPTDTTSRITTSAVDSTVPSWSPDGSRIVFVRANGFYEIFSIQPNGMGLVQHTDTPSVSTNPSYSPDGFKMTYDRGGNPARIYVQSVAGGGATAQDLTADIGGHSFHPAFSPDGTRIAFGHEGLFGAYNVWLMDADGLNKVQVTDLPFARRLTGRGITWAPDGREVFFAAFDGTGNESIFAVDVECGQVRQVTSGAVYDTYPAFAQIDESIHPVHNPANGHYYLRVDAQGIDWFAAKAAAEALCYQGMQGHLVTITSTAEQEFVSNSVMGQGPMEDGHWIGAFQDTNAPDYSEPSGGWRWITGESWNYTSWGSGEPNNVGGNENWALLRMPLNNTWNDLYSHGLNAGNQGNGYVVEFEPPNTAPVAHAGPDQELHSTGPGGTQVQLDGSGSSDDNDDPLTYTWSGSFGTANGVSPHITLPVGVHEITLTVDDGLATDQDTVQITVLNDPPVAHAGPDQLLLNNLPGAATVQLDGTGSSDRNGDNLVYTWTGPFAEGGGLALGPSPAVTLPIGSHVLMLTVSDGYVQSQDTVAIVVWDSVHSVGVAADTYVRQGQPNQNQGAEAFLQVRSSGHNRALVSFDQSQIAQAANGFSVVSAKLRLFIEFNADNWGDGREVAVHRMTQTWSELGATWNCPSDANTGNQKPDGPQWEMQNSAQWPFAASPTSTLDHSNGQLGWVEFDVTADVQAFLSGTPNCGWIVKKVLEGQNGRVQYSSKEGGNPPQLVLTLG